jgi:hypothetical protein
MAVHSISARAGSRRTRAAARYRKKQRGKKERRDGLTWLYTAIDDNSFAAACG